MITLTLRSPERGKVELVVSMGDHECLVYPVSFNQLRLLNAQGAGFIKDWEVIDAPPSSEGSLPG